MMAIEDIVPYSANPRIHAEAQVRALMKSFRQFGFLGHLLVDSTGQLIAGHGRLEAAKRLGMQEIPVAVVGHLTSTQRRAYLIADNKLAENAGWSKSALRSELQDLIELGFDAKLTGFSNIEVDSLLSMDLEELPAAAADEELVEVPDEAIPVSRLGDHWVIGRHHCLCADARDIHSYEQLLGSKKAGMVFTDMPFNTDVKNISGLGKVRHSNFIMGSGELSDGDFVLQLIRPTMRHIVRFAQPGAIAYFCSDWRRLKLTWEAAEGVFVEPRNLLVWGKSNAGMGGFYRQQTEYIVPFKVSPGPTINNFKLGEHGRHRSTLWLYPGSNVFRRGRMEDLADHPTVKPRKLVADAVLDCSARNAIILDPFLGSGTTLAAAEVTGRRGYGLELAPSYCDVILRRLGALTQTEPRLIDGTPFSAVAAARQVAPLSEAFA